MAVSPFNTQGIYALDNLDSQQAGWDGTVNTNFTNLADGLFTFKMEIIVQGSISAASRVRITVQDANGLVVTGVSWIRVRVCDSGGHANAINATMAIGTGVIKDSLTASKDLIIETNTSGVLEVDITDATAETFDVRIGQPEVGGLPGMYTNVQSVTHA